MPVATQRRKEPFADGGPRKARSTRSGRLTGAAPGRYSDRLAVQKFKAELEGLTRDDTKSKFFKAVDNKMIDDGVVKRVPIKATLVVMPALLVQVLAALSEMHSKNILHMDIKPSNIMVSALEEYRRPSPATPALAAFNADT